MVARTGVFVAPVPGSPPQGTSPTDGRLVMGALFGVGAGCLAGGALTASATLMQVSVAAAVWRIPDPTNSAAVYLSPADATTLTFSAGPASGSRIDAIWVRQNNYEASDADSRVVYGVTAGTASTTPTAPAVPAGAMKIGQLTVPTGASNAAAGTLVPLFGGQAVAPPALLVASEAQLPASGAFYGQLAVVPGVTVAGSTLTIVERWNGTAWKRWESDWASYGPPFDLGAGGNLGTGYTVTGTWRYTRGRVVVRTFLGFGSGGVAGAYIRLGLPVTANLATSVGMPFTDVTFRDASDSYRFYFGAAYIESDAGPTTGNTMHLLAVGGAAGTSGQGVELTSTVPFGAAWAPGDQAHATLEYDPA